MIEFHKRLAHRVGLLCEKMLDCNKFSLKSWWGRKNAVI